MKSLKILKKIMTVAAVVAVSVTFLGYASPVLAENSSSKSEVKVAENLNLEGSTADSSTSSGEGGSSESVSKSKSGGSSTTVSVSENSGSSVANSGFDYLGLTEDELSPENLIGVDPDMTVEDIQGRLNTKLGSVAQVFKTVGRWVCMFSMIGCLILCVVSVFSKNNLLFKGLIGAVVSGICYTAITYGEAVMQIMSNFWAS